VSSSWEIKKPFEIEANARDSELKKGQMQITEPRKNNLPSAPTLVAGSLGRFSSPF
jgi:hypothetical protein